MRKPNLFNEVEIQVWIPRVDIQAKVLHIQRSPKELAQEKGYEAIQHAFSRASLSAVWRGNSLSMAHSSTLGYSTENGSINRCKSAALYGDPEARIRLDILPCLIKQSLQAIKGSHLPDF